MSNQIARHHWRIRLVVGLILLVLTVFLTSMSFAATNDTIDKAMPRIVHRWLGKRAAQTHFGIVVQSMKTGKILYQHNANQLFTPASVQKLLTAAAALNYLKPLYTFKTQLLMTGQLKNHLLTGNLFLKFNGDPQLTRQQLEALVQQLGKRGIERIKGRVYIDSSAYDNEPYPPGWVWDDLSYGYAAPVTSAIIDHNYFTLTLKAPAGRSKKPAIVTDLPAGVVDFSNQLAVVGKLHYRCPIRVYTHHDNFYVLRGCYYRHWKWQVRRVAIRNMQRYARVLFATLLHDNKITYRGAIKNKSAPNRARVIAEHASLPLKDIVKKMLKKSDNLTTNAVLKKLGQVYYHHRSTWRDSLQALKLLLTKPTGINFKRNLVEDGAGLSRYNLISPRQLSRVLYYVYHNRAIRSAFIEALPIAGKDGTMKYRLQDQAKGNRIHAKTGNMTGVTALAGYIRTKKQGQVSFVIMINGVVKPRRPYIRLENAICRYLVNGKLPNGKS